MLEDDAKLLIAPFPTEMSLAANVVVAWLEVKVRESVESVDVNPSLPCDAVIVIVGTEVSWMAQTVAVWAVPSTVTEAVTSMFPSTMAAMLPPAPAPSWKLQLHAPVDAWDVQVSVTVVAAESLYETVITALV